MNLNITAHVTLVRPEPRIGWDSLHALRRATHLLNQRTAAIRAALDGTSAATVTAEFDDSFSETSDMANPLVDAAVAAMTQATSVDDSVLAFVQSVPGMIDKAVQDALAGGATAAELAPLTDLSAELTTKTAAIVAAITPNTPVSAAQAKAKKP